MRRTWRQTWIGRVTGLHSPSAHFMSRCWCQRHPTSTWDRGMRDFWTGVLGHDPVDGFYLPRRDA